MAFFPNIPATGQSLGNSRTQVLGNFTNYFNVISQDHVDPNLGGQGKHKQSTYIDLMPADEPITGANETALYGKSVGAPLESELFFAREGAGAIIQMTKGDPIVALNGESFLPGGVIIKWATGTFVSGTITFASLGLTNFPTNAFVAFGTSKFLSANIAITALTQTDFIVLLSFTGYILFIGN